MRDINVLNCIYLSIKDYGWLKPEAIKLFIKYTVRGEMHTTLNGYGSPGAAKVERGRTPHAARGSRAPLLLSMAPRGGIHVRLSCLALVSL